LELLFRTSVYPLNIGARHPVPLRVISPFLQSRMAAGNNSLETAVKSICAENLGLGPEETLLVVADPPCYQLAGRIVDTARKLGFACGLLQLGPVEKAGAAPEEFTPEALACYPAALLVTSRSLSHTETRRRACHTDGVRMASMPGVTEDMLLRLFTPGAAEAISRSTRRLAGRLEGAGRVRVRTASGTNLEFSLKGRKIYLDTGVYRDPGAFGNLPAGELSAAPVAASATGKIVVDVAFAELGAVENLALEIESGSLVAAHGPRSRDLLGLLSGPAERVLGEFGIGTNPLAKPCAITLEAEKAVGTVHFGFGDNRSFGGENFADGHWDAVVRCDQIEVDGKLLNFSELPGLEG
jgi:leucyl aminopeptidase (aminopeptidase T)